MSHQTAAPATAAAKTAQASQSERSRRLRCVTTGAGRPAADPPSSIHYAAQARDSPRCVMSRRTAVTFINGDPPAAIRTTCRHNCLDVEASKVNFTWPEDSRRPVRRQMMSCSSPDWVAEPRPPKSKSLCLSCVCVAVSQSGASIPMPLPVWASIEERSDKHRPCYQGNRWPSSSKTGSHPFSLWFRAWI